ncbi:UDP-N-acetylmuramate--L-alanine ligase [Kitasatospora phosalacinea]|uniref:UDP-N-acetylmuramate--L-alanine ligase n=1 Tax=Kitasatospora phosalacinea TaxID=2065 RepID=A0A9W6V707_9ACTN|nr:hypothetical protein [Kitasatospora phosalacinea]GLW74720.1 UDP-N-acetylmuramate--L-alanine ligase [Kitasatospora phosalacinea]
MRTDITPITSRAAVCGPALTERLSRPHLLDVHLPGMTGLALYLAGAGARVSACAPLGADHQLLAEIERAGVRLHRPGSGFRMVGRSCAVWQGAESRPRAELDAAGGLGIPVLGRLGALGELVDHAPVSVAVTGTHSTEMPAAILTSALAHRNPGWVLNEPPIGAPAGHASGGGLLIADLGDDNTTHEAAVPTAHCTPRVLLVTGIDANPPHTEDFASALAAAERAARRAAAVVLCVWDQGARLLADRLARDPGPQVFTVGRDRDADVRLVQEVWSGSDTHITVQDTSSGEFHQFTLAVPGRHHALAAAAAFAAGLVLGARGVDLARGISAFRGIDGHLTRSGTQRGVTVMASRARHPEEITADLAAARLLTEGRVLAAFEPDGHTRTGALAHRVGEAVALADRTVLLPVHSPMPGTRLDDERAAIRRAAIAAGMPAEQITVLGHGPDAPAAEQVLARLAAPGDLVVTIGAHAAARLGVRLLHHLAAPDTPIPTDL